MATNDSKFTGSAPLKPFLKDPTKVDKRANVPESTPLAGPEKVGNDAASAQHRGADRVK